MGVRRDVAVGAAVLALAFGGAVLVLPQLTLGDPGAYERTTVTAHDENGTELATVEVRIADTAEKRYRGLSDTDSLAMGEGMLFVHDTEGVHGYVMRDMSFPLDIVFVAANGSITRIVHAPVDGAGAPYRARGKYVLEVPRGWANATRLEAGDRIAVPEGV